MSDCLRYTIVFKTAVYTAAVQRAVTLLLEDGKHEVAMKNYWGEGNGYHGINDVFSVPCTRSPTGALKFEVTICLLFLCSLLLYMPFNYWSILM